ncbi:hypothetical protein [Vibrio sp. McD22-P3]|uniref:hypothetical protein n=1 Tax=Vibrio sp. McD22-P3 TaxID=2724880 RepID=UPI001F362759|nr:hypothetical protein [Vibrio sp. McD22-P3]MCF4176880.1 hypothetical protein [Vibrio sp. McD22-P3]
MTKEIIEKNEQLDEIRANSLFLVKALLFQMAEPGAVSDDDICRCLNMIERQLSMRDI